jgi:hypothetical protein
MELNCRETELKSKQLEVFVSHLACKDDYFYFYLIFYFSNFNPETLSHLRFKRNLEKQINIEILIELRGIQKLPIRQNLAF